MNPVKALCSAMFCASLSSPLHADFNHDEARALRISGEILPLTDILQRIRRLYPGDVLSVQLDSSDSGYRYTIELLAPDDHIWELLLDANTGKILKKDLEER